MEHSKQSVLYSINNYLSNLLSNVKIAFMHVKMCTPYIICLGCHWTGSKKVKIVCERLKIIYLDQRISM